MSRHRDRGGIKDDLSSYESSVWIEHPNEGFAPARILRDVGLAEIEVQAADGYRTIVRKDQCTTVHRNSLNGVPNLLELGEFTMAALLHNVRVRYNKGEYYSSIGLPILISVNPYRAMPHLYDAPTRRRYQSAHFVSQSPISSPSALSPAGSDDGLADRKLFIDHPHLFGTAQMTYASLMRNNQAQSIVISGESGAGKTEATKILLRYFSELEDNGGGSGVRTNLRRPSMSPLGGSRLPVGLSPSRAGGGSECVSVELHTLRSNPILEAFGNAKTVRNDNSSRFGKFIQIFFDLKNPKRVRSARISHYLLEKCRLVSVYPPERNFHVFYALLFGARDDSRWFRKLETWALDQPLNFYRILGDDNDWECGGETEMFDELLTCLTSTGFSDEDVENIFATIAGLLHLSTLEFEPVDDPRHAYTAGAPLCRLLNFEALNRTAQILKLETVPAGTQGVSPAEGLLDVLLFKSVRNAEGQGSWIRSGRDVEQACHVRDSIIKEVYSRLFSWIVKRVNRALCSKDESEVASRHMSSFRDIKKRGEALSKAVHRNSMSSLNTSQTTPPIGLLDIYGFEVFEGRNSFEQLCINYANEKLQQHFNHHVLALEQKTYKQEDIDWSEIRFTDNKDIIKALEEPPSGVFVILDDTRVTDKNRDTLFLQQLERSGRKDVVSLPPLKKFKSNVFSVRHYAGDVEYDCTGFVDKNQDKLELQSTFFISRASGSPLLRQLFPTDEFGDMSHRRNSLRATVSLEFRSQLDCLLASLTSTTPTYVRCIKPNGRKLPNTFDSLDALRQLEYAGLLESIRIRKSGFGVRCSFAEFLNEYALLRGGDFRAWRRSRRVMEESEIKSMCQRVLSLISSSRGSWQLGRTKVFMKEETQFELEKKRSSVRTHNAIVIQSFLRGRKARTLYKKRLTVVVFLQALYRGKLARQQVALVRAALRVQRFWKHVRPARRRFLRLRLSVAILQRAVRAHLAKRRRAKMEASRFTPMRQQSQSSEVAKVKPDCTRPVGDDSTQESLEMPIVVPRLELKRAAGVESFADGERGSGRTSTGSHLGKFPRERRRRKHSPASTRTETGNEVLTAFKDLSMQLRKADRLKEGYKREAANLKRQLQKRDDTIQVTQKENDSLTEEIDRRDADILQLLKERDVAEVVNRRLRHQVTCLRNSTEAFERIFSDMYEFVEERGVGMHCEYVQDCLIFMRSVCSRSRHTLTRLDHRIRLVSDEAAYPFPLADDQESYYPPLPQSQSSCGFRSCQMRPCDHVPTSRAGSLRSSVPFELDRNSLLNSRGSPIIDYMTTLDYDSRSVPRNHHMASMSYDGGHDSSFLPALPSQSGRRRHGDAARIFPTWRGDETSRSYHERVSSLTLDSAGPASFREVIFNRGKPPRATHHQSPSSCYNNWTSNSLTCRPSAENGRQSYPEASRQPFHPPTPSRQPLDPYLQMGGKPLVSQRLLQKGTLHGAARPSSSSSNKDGPFASSTSEEMDDAHFYRTPNSKFNRFNAAFQLNEEEPQTFPRKADRHPFTSHQRPR